MSKDWNHPPYAEEQQPFLGTIAIGIGTSILGKTIDKVVDRAIDRVVSRPDVPVERPSATAIKEAIIEEASEMPEIKHLTNTEPWYQSRVTLGALGTVVGSLWGCYLIYLESGLNITLMWPLLTTAGGAAVTLWGRWVAKKPLGA
jgi:hypothetical protein